jgi:hypothetical protein
MRGLRRLILGASQACFLCRFKGQVHSSNEAATAFRFKPRPPLRPMGAERQSFALFPAIHSTKGYRFLTRGRRGSAACRLEVALPFGFGPP